MIEMKGLRQRLEDCFLKEKGFQNRMKDFKTGKITGNNTKTYSQNA